MVGTGRSLLLVLKLKLFGPFALGGVVVFFPIVHILDNVLEVSVKLLFTCQ